MIIESPGIPASPKTIPADGRGAETPEAAARQFEAVLARQFVQTMTEGLFAETLAGDDGPGWMKGRQDAQRDVLTDVLTKHLVESGALRLSEMLLRQWQRRQPDAAGAGAIREFGAIDRPRNPLAPRRGARVRERGEENAGAGPLPLHQSARENI